MHSPRANYLAIAFATACGWVLVALFDPSLPREQYLVGMVLGTIYAQAAVAAVVSALGPARLPWRLLPPLAAMSGLLVAIAIMTRKKAMGGTADFVLIGGSALLQWLLVQLPLWGLRGIGGVRVQQGDGPRLAEEPPQAPRLPPQFAIRQLMLLTAIVAVVLAVGRIVLERFQWQVPLTWGVSSEAPIFTYIVLVNCLLTLPLALAALVRRRAVLACAIGLAFIAGATTIEISAAYQFIRGAPSSRFPLIFWTMNVTQAVWVLGLLLLLRQAGFRLATRSRPRQPTAAFKAAASG